MMQSLNSRETLQPCKVAACGFAQEMCVYWQLVDRVKELGEREREREKDEKDEMMMR